jgi:hypothetical protein
LPPSFDGSALPVSSSGSGAAHRRGFRWTRALGDAMRDVIDRVIAGHVLLLQEVGGVAFALGEDRHQHVGAGHLIAAGRLDMDHGALNDALESCGGLGILVISVIRSTEFLVDIIADGSRSCSSVDIAGLHHRRSVGIVHQRQKQMLQRGVFMMPLIGIGQRLMDRFFETTLEKLGTVQVLTFFPSRIAGMLILCGRNP